MYKVLITSRTGGCDGSSVSAVAVDFDNKAAAIKAVNIINDAQLAKGICDQVAVPLFNIE